MLVVLGDPGMGKSTLLATAADQARSAGLRCYRRRAGSGGDLAFAGLHQLLAPVLDAAAGHPRHQARALLGGLGLAAEPAAADPLVTRIAALALLSDISESAPVLAAINDAHSIDRSSSTCWPSSAPSWTPNGSACCSARGGSAAPGFDHAGR